MEHLSKCCGVYIDRSHKNDCNYIAKRIKLSSIKGKHTCKIKQFIDIPVLVDHTKIKDNKLTVIGQSMIESVVETTGSIQLMPQPVLARRTYISQSIPMAGRILVVKIKSGQNKHKSNRIKDIDELLKLRKTLYAEYFEIKYESQEDTFGKLQQIFNKAIKTNRNILLLTFDAFPSIIKQDPEFVNRKIATRDNIKVYIPDMLAYNVMQRKIVVSDMTEQMKENIKQEEEFDILRESKETELEQDEKPIVQIIIKAMIGIALIIIMLVMSPGNKFIIGGIIVIFVTIITALMKTKNLSFSYFKAHIISMIEKSYINEDE